MRRRQTLSSPSFLSLPLNFNQASASGGGCGGILSTSVFLPIAIFASAPLSSSCGQKVYLDRSIAKFITRLFLQSVKGLRSGGRRQSTSD